MFLGEFQHTLDPKGRVILPSALRDELGERVVITVGLDNCLTVHPTQDWDRVIAELRTMDANSSTQRGYMRVVTSAAHSDVLDRQGRITIPARLRAYAQLSKDVAVLGRDTHIELWDVQRWESYRDSAMAEFAATDQPFGAAQL